MRTRYAWLVVSMSVAGLGAAGEDVQLVEAAKAGNREVVQVLLQQRANVNAPEADGTTALHWAVRANDGEMTELLIRAGANVKAATRYGVTPLSLAATNGNAALIETLIRAGADPNTARPEGETVLMTAARTGSPDAVKILVEHGANVNAQEEWQGQTALMWAATENNAAAVKVLSERGADLNARSKVLSFPEFSFETSGMVITMLPKGGWTPLMYAARQGSLDATRMLADMNADLNATDPDGTTALMLAIINAHFDLAHVLLEEGADPNVADINGTTALYWAVDMNTLGSVLSRPPPKWVDAHGAADTVKELLARGANPNARLKRPIIGRHHALVGDTSMGDGTTPLARAAKSNDLSVMRLLLDAGADPTLTLKDRTTVVMIAAAGGRQVGAYVGALRVTEATSLEAIELVVERGVDVRAFNTGGETALHMAAARGADSIVRFLVEKGAKPDVKNKRGQTPLDVAAPGGGRGGAAGGRESSTAGLLRELMGKDGITASPADETAH